MKISKYAAVLLGTGVVVAACAAASQIRQLQPPQVTAAQRITLPETAVSAAPRAFQRGIDIDWYSWPGEDVAGGAVQAIAYARRLHADAISVSFPFFMKSNADSVQTNTATPTPADMRILLSAARRAGMYVSVRPLLDEKSLGHSRLGFVPSDPRAWFRSYARFLRPYALVAQRYHAGEFIVGSELKSFNLAPGWAGLDRYLRRRYHGTLACADNWDRVVKRGCATRVQTVDAYHPAHTADYLAAWESWDATLPAGMMQTEVGIAAAAPAPRKPWVLSWPGSPLDPRVQARWFTAACHAAVRAHLGGIYFWSIGLGTPSSHGPTLASETTWAGGPGARAIARCYASVERSH